MLNTVMSTCQVKVLAAVILVTASAASAAATAVEPNDLTFGRSLDATGLTNNHTDLTVSENDIVDDQWEFMAERKKSCSPTISCSRAGGYCVKARADCAGTVDPNGCKGGKKCKCCIPDQSTPPPVTCPTVTCTPCPDVTTPPVTTYTTTAITTEGSDESECPSGFFMAAGSSQCYKLYNDELRYWRDSNSKCASEGYVMAHPNNPVAVRDLLVTTYGLNAYTWLGAKANGTAMIWQESDVELPSTSSYWKPGGYNVNSGNVLFLLTSVSWMTSYPTAPFFANSDSWKHWTLCEESECPSGFFMAAGSSQCYKLYNDELRYWRDANSKCASEGYVMAHPNNPVAVRDLLVTTFGLNAYTWLGAKANGTAMIWQESDVELPSTSSYWKPGGYNVNSGNVLFLLTSVSWMTSYPTAPFFANSDSWKHWTLCEEE